MKSFHKRLDNIDDHLSPTDIVLRWLQEDLKPPSAHEQLAALTAMPKSAWPLYRLTDEAERVATASMRDTPRNKIDVRVREYVRDVVLLWRLHLEVNVRIDYELRPASALIAFLLSKLRSRSGKHASQSDARDACRDRRRPQDCPGTPRRVLELPRRPQDHQGLGS